MSVLGRFAASPVQALTPTQAGLEQSMAGP
jgi:hypothetical protein